ncbi:hypothetical protein ASG35_27205 [Burkholderia sp. Leaf177]|uniref:glycosyltransferase n=1 Tax=Burkholderia sp. Leaf177 TaxID=1736287 RepID=UPI0006F2B418|nr:glycosyltransferase [Burkholderia sp. Leaf177]KQR85475.1 hypothetical protein ASG35_27205 [Burkholderia sp. Leaf177]
MRVVIDLQSAQGANRLEATGQNALAFTQAFAKLAGAREVLVVLSDGIYETVEPIRMALADSVPHDRIIVFPVPAAHSQSGRAVASEWTLRAAEKIREAFIADLRPDVVLILGLFEGLTDDLSVSIGSFERSAPTAVLLHELLSADEASTVLLDDATRKWYRRHIMFARVADRIMTVSSSMRTEAIERLQLDPQKVIALSHCPVAYPGSDCGAEDRDSLLARLGLSSRFVLVDAVHADAATLRGVRKRFAALPPALREGLTIAIAGDTTEVMGEHVVYLPGLSNGERQILSGWAAACVFKHGSELSRDANFMATLKAGAPVVLISETGAAVSGKSVAEPMCTDMAGFSSALESLLADGAERATLSMLALRRAQSLMWTDAAERAWAVCSELHEAHDAERVAPAHAPVRRPRMAYFSPLPPAQSGIADYSAVLLPELAFYYEIDVIVDTLECSADAVSTCFAIRDLEWFEAHAGEYDRVIYHIGNSPFHHYMLSAFDRYPGTVVLHDFYLGHLRMHPAGADPAYMRALYESHGFGAAADALRNPDAFWLYPTNLPLLTRAHGVLVHSEHAIDQARMWYGDHISKYIRRVRFLRAGVRPDRVSARARLGISENDFVVCSFGQVGPTKLSHVLLSAWAQSRLTSGQHCKLVFVGGSAGLYRDTMIRGIERCGSTYDVMMTGFAPAELYRDYLDAADLAVQLRTDSRGETSAAAFDCLAHEVPLIVNAHGSMSELPDDTVLRLVDNFDEAELTAALEQLWGDRSLCQQLTRSGSAYLALNHAPHAAAADFARAIEFFEEESGSARRARLIDSITKIRVETAVEDSDALSVARALDEALPDITVRTLFVDVSAVARVDLRTGVERVTRGILLELLKSPPAGWRVEPVYLSDGADKGFHYARRYVQRLLGLEVLELEDEPVRPLPGDILFGLDLYWPAYMAEEAYQQWRALGVSIQFVVYDILPVLQPHHFPDGFSENFEKWLRLITSVSDGLLCISQAVANEVAAWVNGHPAPRALPLQIKAFPLGADLQTSAPTRGVPDDAAQLLQTIASRPSVLMVGTVEPRKKHLDALAAMDRLWSRGTDVNLVIVGKQGWLTTDDAARLADHPERDKRFFWLSGVSDEFLDAIYKASTVLLAASSGEGFGLPLIEAAVHGVPVIARDLPVFREVAGDSATYFAGDDSALADALGKWLFDTNNGNRARLSRDIKLVTWEQSATALKRFMFEIRSRNGDVTR